MNDVFLWDEHVFQALSARFFRRRECTAPQARPGYMVLKYDFALPGTERALESDAFAVAELNGYQMAFYAINQILAELARDQVVVHSYHLKLSWPKHRDAADLELFYEGLCAVAEQQGFLFGAVTATLGLDLALAIEVWALREEVAVAVPEVVPGDVLWMLAAPGEAAAGRALMQHREAFLDIDETYREHMIQAYLQAPPLLHVARFLRQAELPVAAQSLRQGMSRALRHLIPEHFGLRASPIPGTAALMRLAKLCGDDGMRWIYAAADAQLLWRSPAARYEETRALLWNRLELEVLEIGRVVEDSREHLEPPEAVAYFEEAQDLNR